MPEVIMPTLVTVPTDAALEIAVTLPYWSTVIAGYVYDPAIAPELAKSILITPLLTIGLLETTNREVDTGSSPTLVTVPPLPLPPPDALIVISPVVPDNVTPVPAVKLVTPVFVIVIVFVFASALVSIPLAPVKVLYGLAHANNVLKLVAVLVNAVYRESLPVDSLGNPIPMTCIPEIAMI
jgi:hypothetical protein